MKKNYPLFENKFSLKLAIFIALFGFFISSAQVTTNGGSGLSPTYPDLASAITALNAASISSPVVITLDASNPQTAPAGGYSITAQGTAINTIVIEGTSNVITASNALTAGALNDAIFKLLGADWVTIRGFTLLENAANTTTAAGTNNMTEWGVALLYATTTNGAQNNTIRNNTIDLDRTYQNTFGIYSNSTHSAANVTTTATATTATGGNNGLKIYSNNVTDVNLGIVVIGPTAIADQNVGIDIGGASLATANTVTNFGTNGTFSGFANVSATVNGILVRNSNGINISYNTITSSAGGITSGTLNGIQVAASSNVPTATFTNTINNNIISLRSGVAAGAINGINYPSGSASATSTLNINANDFNTCGHTVASSGTIIFILTASTNQFTTINNNTFTNISLNTSGSVTFISQSFTAPATGTKAVNNNAIVTGFTKTVAGGTVIFVTDNGSTVSGAVSNCINNNFSNVTLTGATTLTGINYTDGGTAPTRTVTGNILNNITTGAATMNLMNFTYWNGVSSLSNNTITNINGQGAITGITLGSSANTATSVTVTLNTINNLVSSGVGGAVTGINCSNTSPSISISNNSINTLSSTGASLVSGIQISGASATGTNVFKNKIYNLSGSNASSTVNGLSISAGTLITAYNNIIGDLRTPNANAANPLIGINITGGTTVNAYNNTVLLNGASLGALFGSSAVSVSTTPNVTLSNNIFVNNSTISGAGLAVAYRRSTATLTTYAAASNNNLFFANIIYTDGTNSDATLAAYKIRVATRDAASVTENPTFANTVGSNPTFLHFNAGTLTQSESGGIPIGIVTDDFDGDTRNASTPDIGADEFVGVQGVPADLTAPSIVHTTVANSCLGGSRTISATITDASGVPTSGLGLPVAYWSVNAGPYVAATGTSAGADVYNFSIGTGSIPGDVVRYYFVAQDNAATSNTSALPAAGAAGFTANPPAVITAPTTPFSYSISQLNGVYTVGVGGNFTTLTAAINAYNTTCLTGPITLSLTDATYAGETFPITINQNADASATNTLTIKPAIGVSTTISGSSAVAIFKINAADWVTINGTSGSGVSRDLTIENTNSGTIIWIASTATNGALNTVVKNTNLVGNTLISAQGIIVSGSSLGAAAEVSNNNLTITNNTFKKVQNAVFAIGNASSPDQNWLINNNVAGSGIVAEKLSFRGIAVQNAQNFIISGNQITGVVTSTTSTSTASGILVGSNAFNGNVFSNTIADIKNTNTTGYGSNGIYLNSSSTTANINVYNNIISDVASYGYSTAFVGDNGYGIFVNSGAGYNIDYNTVNMNTNQTLTTGLPAAINIAVGVTVAGAVNLRNNIFSNSQTQAGERYTIYSAAPNTVFGVINNNNYSTTGTNLGFIGSNRASLANIQTGFGQNTASVNITPVFVSATNLHLVPFNNAALDNLGTPVAGITVDIDADLRSATTPDIGADEFTSVAADCSFTTTWAGSSWNNGTPIAGVKALFTGSYSGPAINACAVNVNSPANVVFTSGNSTVEGAVTVQAGATLTLNNNVNLIQTTNVANSGNITVKRNTNPLMRFDYVMWSSPVDGTQTLTGFSPLTSVSPTIRFYNYDSVNNVYTSVLTPSTTEFSNASGYLIRLPFDHPTTPTTWAGSFSGVPNNGPISLGSLTTGLYYATGNPYPSTINADAFITANSLNDALYFWRKTNGATGSAYATYTLAGGTLPSPGTLASPTSGIPNGTIQVGQGFIAKASSASFVFDNTMRVANNANQTFKSSLITATTSTIERNRIWLNLANDTETIGQTMVSYMTGATNGLDAQIDGQYFNDSPTALTSIVGGQEYAIQGRVLPFTATDIVPLGFKTETAGNYSISIFDKDGLFADNAQVIYLRDNVTNTIQNLNSGAYNFTSQAGVFNGRFDVLYQNSLSTDDVEFTSNNVSIYNQNNILNINSGNNLMSTVKVFDIRGRLIAQIDKINATETQINIPATNQTLIVQITSSEGIVVVKKVAN